MEMQKIYVFLLLSFCICLNIFSQTGGNSTYAFLNLTNSARVASLGGKSVALWENDLNLPFHNPSLLNTEMDNHLVINYVGYFADIKYGYTSYSRSYGKIGNFAAGIHYINYGNFTAADLNGNKTGAFNASEYALNLICSRTIDTVFHIGINFKPVYSIFEKYNSFGFAIDLGFTWHDPESLFTAAFTLKNIGSQIITYYDGNREPLPFEILAGVSQRLEHAPFRFSLLLQHLQKFDLSYESPLEQKVEFDPFTGQPLKTNRFEALADNLMRHAIIGVEFLPGENFYVNLGYNYLRRQELKISSRPAMTGFSWGFGVKISKFHLSFGRAAYHLAGASNHFSLSSNLSEFYRKNN